jgi:fluoride exporter
LIGSHLFIGYTLENSFNWTKRPKCETMVLLSDLALVSIGAVAGACTRHTISEVAAKKGLGPWHIAGINVIGSGLLGITSTHPSISSKQRLMFGVGFCGAFTTFSTFSVDVVKLVEANQILQAFGYIAGNNVLSVGAALIGMKIGRAASVNRLKTNIKHSSSR